MTVILDRIEESRATVGANGREVERAALVTNVTGSRTAKLINALTAPGLPRYGDPHPDDPTITVQTIDARPNAGDTSFTVLFTYRDPNALAVSAAADIVPEVVSEIEFSADVTNETTNRDIDGNLMVATYTGQPDQAAATAGQIVLGRDLVEIDYLKPSLAVTLEVNHRELPRDNAIKYIGTINADRWSGFEPLTWLVTEIVSRRERGLFNTRYRFLYRRETWRATHEVQTFGFTPRDARDGNGLAEFRIYPETTFSGLRVAF